MDTVGMVDCWLAERVQRLVAPVAVRLELWDGTSPFVANRHAPVGGLIVRDRLTLLGLLVNPELWFGEAYMAGRLEIDGALEPVLEALSRLRRRPRLNASVMPRVAVPNSLRDAAPQHPPPLRPRQRLLPALARRRDGVHLRLLRRPRRRRSRTRSAPRSISCAASCGCGPGRRVVEAGCGWGALALHMARHYGVRCGPSTSRASSSRSRASARGREGLDRPGRVHRRRLPQRRRAMRRLRLGRHAGARGPAHFRTPGRGDRPLLRAARRPRPAALHRPRRAAAAECVDPAPHLSRAPIRRRSAR